MKEPGTAKFYLHCKILPNNEGEGQPQRAAKEKSVQILVYKSNKKALEKTLTDCRYDLEDWNEIVSAMESLNFDDENVQMPQNCEMKCQHIGQRHNLNCYVSFKVDLSNEDLRELPWFFENIRQVNKLRYDPEKKVWRGIVDHCYGIHSNKLETLPNQWVTENFSETFLNKLKKRSERESRFVRIPPGAPRSSSVVPARFFRKNAPKVHYLQGLRFTCASDSFASALFHMRHYYLASNLSVRAKKKP
jgi:hypothetical protein